MLHQTKLWFISICNDSDIWYATDIVLVVSGSIHSPFPSDNVLVVSGSINSPLFKFQSDIVRDKIQH